MITYEEALELLRASGRVLSSRSVPLSQASGGVTAAAVSARLSVPGFANAAMDGYAVLAAATSAASAESPVRFSVAGLIPAGSGPPPTADPGTRNDQAWEILTGAPVPAGLDAVVPLERVTRLEAGTGRPAVVQLTRPLQPGHNIRNVGEDFVTGQRVVAAGTRLAPHHLMGLAACGVDDVVVRCRPRVAVLTTGSELDEQGADLAPGRIRDANGPYLRSVLPFLGASLATTGRAADNATELRGKLEDLAAGADVVLTTGGVSAGRLDLLPAVVREIGGEIIFHKVAIRPGKPVLYARLPGGVQLFGLPGNPLAVAVGMRFFVVPALRALQGLPAEQAMTALALEPVRGRGNLHFFAKACAHVDASGCRRVRILPGQESFRIAPLLEANCWAIVPPGTDEIPAGGTLHTLPLYPDDCLGPPERL